MVEQYQIAGSTASEIVASVETGVHLGALEPGAPLPPVRVLAAELGLAAATVAAAYRALRQRGIVDTAGRHGTRVRRRPAILHRGSQSLPDGVVDLASGDPDPALLPDLSAALETVPASPAGYRQAGPLPDLLEAAGRRFAADGVSGAVTVTGGALDGIQRTLAGHAAPGDAVAIEDPCWANLRDLIVSMGMRPEPMPVDDQGPTPEGMDAALRRASAAVITSRAHNPTGAFITAGRAAALRAVLSDHPAVLAIEDDHWAELSDDPLSLVADAAPRWLFIRSVSKPYGPDLRCAAACGDDTTIARLQGRMRLGAGWVSTILQHLVLGVWNDPRTPEVLRAARESYRRRRVELLESLAAEGIEASGHTGLNVWVPVDDETGTVTALRDRGYAVSPGAGFRIDAPPAIRVTVSRLRTAEAPALAGAIAAARRASYPLA